MRIYEFVYRAMPEGYRKWIEDQMRCADFTIPPSKYSGFSMFYGLAIGVFTLLIVLLLDLVNLQISIVIGLFASIVFEIFMHVLPMMVADKRAKFADEVLPDALRLISSNIRSGLTPDKALLLSARPEFGPLEKEIRTSAKLTVSGEPIESAVQAITKRINSKTLKYCVDLLTEGIIRGGNLPSLLDGLANDIRQTKILKKEVQAIVMMYAIFIFFAAGIGAPLLYGISSFLVKTMQEIGGKATVSSNLPSGMKFMTFQEIKLTPEFLMIYVSISLGVTALFGGMLVGLIQEGSEKAGLKYIPVLLALSLSIFFLTRMVVERMFGITV
jgi:hypothetical protein